MANKVMWALGGALIGFGLISLASIGIFVLVVAVGVTLPLLILRAPGSPWFLIGAGVTLAITWMSLVLDPNAPDDALWPVALGVAIAGAGALGARTSPRARG